MSEIVEVVKEFPYKARDVFKEYHQRKERWAVLVCHRRAGKTVACLADLLRRAIKENKPDGRYAYVAPFISQSKNIAWNYLVKFAAPAIAKKNESELWVELVNGARIRLFGADNYEALRGLYLDGIVLDEYADFRAGIFGQIIRPLLADRKGWATFIGTPKGHNAFYEIYLNATQSPDWFVRVWRASQTGLLDQEELEDAARMMSEDQYNQEFECDFEAAILGAFYGKEMRTLTDAGRITKVEHDPAYPVHTSWDLGFNDSTAIWWWTVVRGEIRMLDFHASSGNTIEFYGELIKSKAIEHDYIYGTHYLPHDARAKTLASGGKSIIEQLSSYIPLKMCKIVPSLSVQDGIQAARVALERTWFDHKCNEGIECLRQYQREWDDSKRMFRDKPLHDWTSHGADAFRMAAIAWKEDAKVIPRDGVIRGLEVGGTSGATLNELWRDSSPRQIGRI